jgi:hypothetical protein
MLDPGKMQILLDICYTLDLFHKDVHGQHYRLNEK